MTRLSLALCAASWLALAIALTDCRAPAQASTSDDIARIAAALERIERKLTCTK